MSHEKSNHFDLLNANYLISRFSRLCSLGGIYQDFRSQNFDKKFRESIGFLIYLVMISQNVNSFTPDNFRENNF